jgi:hypothetical protein
VPGYPETSDPSAATSDAALCEPDAPECTDYAVQHLHLLDQTFTHQPVVSFSPDADPYEHAGHTAPRVNATATIVDADGHSRTVTVDLQAAKLSNSYNWVSHCLGCHTACVPHDFCRSCCDTVVARSAPDIYGESVSDPGSSRQLRVQSVTAEPAAPKLTASAGALHTPPQECDLNEITFSSDDEDNHVDDVALETFMGPACRCASQAQSAEAQGSDPGMVVHCDLCSSWLSPGAMTYCCDRCQRIFCMSCRYSRRWFQLLAFVFGLFS